MVSVVDSFEGGSAAGWADELELAESEWRRISLVVCLATAVELQHHERVKSPERRRARRTALKVQRLYLRLAEMESSLVGRPFVPIAPLPGRIPRGVTLLSRSIVWEDWLAQSIDEGAERLLRITEACESWRRYKLLRRRVNIAATEQSGLTRIYETETG